MQVEYLRQGSLKSVDEYPKKEFFTFWNWQDDNAAFFDNTPHKRIAAFTICYYTQNPQQLYSRMDEFIHKVMQHGGIVKGRGTDCASDSPEYPGRTVDIYFVV